MYVYNTWVYVNIYMNTMGEEKRLGNAFGKVVERQIGHECYTCSLCWALCHIGLCLPFIQCKKIT